MIAPRPTGESRLRALTALPVYNEVAHLEPVLREVLRYSEDVLVVDDGSTDGSGDAVRKAFPQIQIETHPQNRGYGAALQTAFDYAVRNGYDILITIDCDGQHEPQRIPEFIAAASEPGVDIVSGSRYLKDFDGDSPAPAERRRINKRLTAELNRRLGLGITDAFCGFKAYRTEALQKFRLSENGYSMPLEVWVQASALGLHVVELAVPRIYLDEKRSFGGALDNGATRLEYYHLTLDRSIAHQQHIMPLANEMGLAQFGPCGEPAS